MQHARHALADATLHFRGASAVLLWSKQQSMLMGLDTTPVSTFAILSNTSNSHSGLAG